MENYLSVKEASERYGLSRTQINRLLRAGKIRGRRFGHFWVVAPESIKAYIENPPRPGLKKGQKISRKRY